MRRSQGPALRQSFSMRQFRCGKMRQLRCGITRVIPVDFGPRRGIKFLRMGRPAIAIFLFMVNLSGVLAFGQRMEVFRQELGELHLEGNPAGRP